MVKFTRQKKSASVGSAYFWTMLSRFMFLSMFDRCLLLSRVAFFVSRRICRDSSSSCCVSAVKARCVMFLNATWAWICRPVCSRSASPPKIWNTRSSDSRPGDTEAAADSDEVLPFWRSNEAVNNSLRSIRLSSVCSRSKAVCSLCASDSLLIVWYSAKALLREMKT